MLFILSLIQVLAIENKLLGKEILVALMMMKVDFT